MNDKVRIAGAVGVGVIIIALAFQLSLRNAESQGAAVITAPPREVIVDHDVDSNGTPDWEDHLAQNVFKTITLPSSSSTVSANTTGYVPPTTLTGKFSEAFLQDYLQGKMDGKDFSDPTAFIDTAVSAIEQNAQSIRHTTADVTSVPTTQESLRTYGNALQEIANRYAPSTPPENEMAILERALTTNDPQALQGLTPIAEGYQHIITDTLHMSVPNTLVGVHLAILNGYEDVYTDIQASQQAFTDPLYTLARTRNYETHVKSLLTAYVTLAHTLADQGIVYTSDEPGAFYNDLKAIDLGTITP